MLPLFVSPMSIIESNYNVDMFWNVGGVPKPRQLIVHFDVSYADSLVKSFRFYHFTPFPGELIWLNVVSTVSRGRFLDVLPVVDKGDIFKKIYYKYINEIAPILFVYDRYHKGEYNPVTARELFLNNKVASTIENYDRAMPDVTFGPFTWRKDIALSEDCQFVSDATCCICRDAFDELVMGTHCNHQSCFDCYYKLFKHGIPGRCSKCASFNTFAMTYQKSGLFFTKRTLLNRGFYNLRKKGILETVGTFQAAHLVDYVDWGKRFPDDRVLLPPNERNVLKLRDEPLTDSEQFKKDITFQFLIDDLQELREDVTKDKPQVFIDGIKFYEIELPYSHLKTYCQCY